MKIGVFNPILHRVGGAEYVTIVLVNALKEQGHRVVLVSNKKIDSATIAFFFGKDLDVETRVFPFSDFSERLSFRNPIGDYVNALQSYFLKLNCQILVDTFSDFIHPWSDVTYFQVCPRCGNLSPRARDLSSFLYVPLLKASMTEDKAVLVVSRFVANFLEKKGIHCSVLYPPVNVCYFSDANKNFCGSKEDMAVTVSRFSNEKKLENIPIIAKQVDKGVSFVIAGSCQSNSAYKVLHSLQGLIKKLEVGERVRLLPNVSREKIRELLWNSKVYLHTRENEPFGITIIEAMSSGCLPIVHDSGGPREFVPKYLRYKTIEEAVIKIEKAILGWSPGKSKKMSSIANRFNEKEFSSRFLGVLNSYIENQFQR